MKTVVRSVCLSLLPLIFFAVSPAQIAAQEGAIAGTVRDSASAVPLAAVFVQVVDASGGVIADGASGPGGAFRIAGVPAGSYTVRFTTPGWLTANVAATVTAGQTTSLTGEMVELSYNLNPITVTASKTEEKVLDAPAAVAVVNATDIAERPATTPVDHIKEQEGVDVITTGLQGHYAVIRGFNNIFSGATLTLTDNRIARVPSLRANISHLNPITNMDLERIELVLGPGSALYGPNAANGVIHSITKSPIDYPGVSLSVAGGLRQQREGVGDQATIDSNDERVYHTEGRVAISPSEKFGVKLSGQYFTGEEYIFVDPVEALAGGAAAACIANGFDATTEACFPFTAGLDLTNADDQAIFRQSVNNVAAGRDNKLKRWTLDARVDWRPNEETSIIVAGGRTQAVNSIDLTGLGAAQVVDWGYSYVQGRLLWKDLFAQVFFNKSDNEDTYLLRSGKPLIDKSQLFVGQLQHASQIGTTHRFIYGADLLLTNPQSGGTINGKNEGDDKSTEVGAYVQWEWAIDPRLDFVAAARVDNHSLLEDPVFSPRAAFVYKPDNSNSFRATFNRAFSTPTTLNFFLDISGQISNVFGPFNYDVRAQGGTANGMTFLRDENGIPMHQSPFGPLIGQSNRAFLPSNTATLWAEAVGAVSVIDPQAGGLLGLIQAPTDEQVPVVARTANVTDGSFALTPGGLAGLQDIPRLKPTITNTLELGYKGLLGDRVLVGLNAWYSQVTDFISALRVSSPHLFLDGPSLGAHLGAQFVPLVGIVFPDQATALATAAQLAGQIAMIPLGVATPQEVGGNISTVAVAYRNLGSFNLFGGELGATILLTDDLEISGTLSVVSKDEFVTNEGEVDEEIVPLNAAKVKGSGVLRYRNDDAGFNGQIRFRAQNGFRANSGFFVGEVESYAVLDLGLGYKIPGIRGVWLQLDIQNLFDTRYATFVGTPELGRFSMLRLRYDFSPF